MVSLDAKVVGKLALSSYREVNPMIYAYTTPGVTYHEGWIKIGFTETQSPEERVRQQAHTIGVKTVLEWSAPAFYVDGRGGSFKDHDFHAFLREQGVKREPGTEWFQLSVEESQALFNAFAGGSVGKVKTSDYVLRHEQAEAVMLTKAYFERAEREGGPWVPSYLWNAKPRFGKTLTAYDLIRQMGFKKVLVITNRPAIGDSWANDFSQFIGWREELGLRFVSEIDGLRKRRDVLSRASFVQSDAQGFVAFESLQGLKGSRFFGGKFDKLDWIANTAFDLLIVDEAHEGVETEKADFAIEKLKHRFRLHLSGTPFKLLSAGGFTKDRIFNWTYVDEQEAKAAWAGEANNPYEALPKLEMYTYQLGPMAEAKAERGIQVDESGNLKPYAFDLMEFFKTKPNQDKFEYEDKVIRFLEALRTQAKYPFSTPELREELRHSVVSEPCEQCEGIGTALARGSRFRGV